MRTLPLYAKLARSVILFRGLSPTDVSDIFNAGLAVRLAREEVVVRKGEYGKRMFLIIEGQAGVYDDEELLAKLGPGEIFGEMALFSNEPRSATVTALEPTVALTLSQHSLQNILSKRIAVTLLLNLVQILCGRLRETNRQLKEKPRIDLGSLFE